MEVKYDSENKLCRIPLEDKIRVYNKTNVESLNTPFVQNKNFWSTVLP